VLTIIVPVFDLFMSFKNF